MGKGLSNWLPAMLGCAFLAVSSWAQEPAVELKEPAVDLQAALAPTATSPWNFEKLSKAPEFEWADREGTVRSLFYKGEPYDGHPTRVFAYFATPGTLAGDASLDKKLPAVVLVHGGGGTAFRDWAELWAKRGYAAIAMDLAGYRPMEDKNPHDGKNRNRLPDGGPDQGDGEKFGSIDKAPEEQWSYHAVADVLLAHSLIRSFDEVDAERTAVTGISWGGYLTCIVAGVDPRFKAAVPVYGCGFLHENSCWLGQFEQLKPEQRDRWVKLWDPSQYLPNVSMPILMVNGTNDFAYPLDSYMKSYAAIPGQKQLCVTVNMPHGHIEGWNPKEIGLFIDSQLRGSDPLAVIGDVKESAKGITAPVHGKGKLKSASLHWTTDGGEINKRKWQSQTLKLDTDEVTGEGPPSDTTAWFVTVVDERDATVSSQVTLR